MRVVVTQTTPAGREELVTDEVIVFSGGEPHPQLGGINHSSSCFRIYVDLRTATHAVAAVLMADAIRGYYEGNEEAVPPIFLHTRYFPGARQDRRVNLGEAFSAKIYAGIVNSGGFAAVEVWDPHSTVITGLLDRPSPIHVDAFAPEVARLASTQSSPFDTVIAPDAGAASRAWKFARKLNLERLVQCLKERDLKTGRLGNFRVLATPEEAAGRRALIVDDLCDAGTTFIELTQILLGMGFASVDLYVTHALMRKGVEPLRAAGIRTMYSPNPWVEDGSGFLLRVRPPEGMSRFAL